MFWTGATGDDLLACASTYLTGMFEITGRIHRYFAHRSCKTGRAFQLLLASGRHGLRAEGALWWGANPRHHRAHSDTARDTHSPVTGGFWWARAGWFLRREFDATRERLIPDRPGYPEPRFLNRFHRLPQLALAGATFTAGGGRMLAWVLLDHATFSVSSLAHLFGTRRFETRDRSRNHFLIALVTLGEGWHNHHRHSPVDRAAGAGVVASGRGATRAEALSRAGLVWVLRQPAARR